ncbi:MAG: tetratricopeptide repeat protein, partial [Thalassolituus sp.]
MTVAELLHQGVSALSQGDVSSAEASFRSALDIDPDNANAHNNLGFALAQKQDWNNALIHLRSA